MDRSIATPSIRMAACVRSRTTLTIVGDELEDRCQQRRRDGTVDNAHSKRAAERREGSTPSVGTLMYIE